MQSLASCLTVFVICLCISGCMATSFTSIVSGSCTNKTLPVLLDSTDLKSLFRDMADELCIDTCSDCAGVTNNGKESTQACVNRYEMDHKTVLVTDFADLQTFLPNQPGLLMGELMRASLNKVCCYKIIQAEFARFFKLSENGLVVLTRKASEIKKDEYYQSEAIVGTYSYVNNNKLLIFVRKINTETGKITKMVTREVTYNCAGRSVTGYTAK